MSNVTIVVPQRVLEIEVCSHGERLYMAKRVKGKKSIALFCPRHGSTEKVIRDTACETIWKDSEDE